MVIILNAKEFTEYIGYHEKELEKYDYTRYLAKKAFYDNEAYVELEELSKNARSKLERLKEKHLLSQKDFEHYLSSNGLNHLLE